MTRLGESRAPNPRRCGSCARRGIRKPPATETLSISRELCSPSLIRSNKFGGAFEFVSTLNLYPSSSRSFSRLARLPESRRSQMRSRRRIWNESRESVIPSSRSFAQTKAARPNIDHRAASIFDLHCEVHSANDRERSNSKLFLPGREQINVRITFGVRYPESTLAMLHSASPRSCTDFPSDLFCLIRALPRENALNFSTIAKARRIRISRIARIIGPAFGSKRINRVNNKLYVLKNNTINTIKITLKIVIFNIVPTFT